MSFLKFHMLYLLASAAVWMLFGSDTLSVDARLYTNLVVLSACLHSFWLLVTLSRQQMAAWYATTECGAGLSCVAAKGQGPTAQTPVVLKVSEDSDVHSNNCWAEPSFSIHHRSRQTDRNGGVGDLWRDSKVVIWILAQAGTCRWRKQAEHFIY